MKYVASRLWPGEPELKSYFGLVQQFLGSVPHVDAMKRSACIEGAQMALARVKTYWADMKASLSHPGIWTKAEYLPGTTLRKFFRALV